MLLNQKHAELLHTQCQLLGIPDIIPTQFHGKNSYQETRGKSLLISLHSDKSPATCADILQCVWNNGDPGECYICSWKMSSKYIQINGCAMDFGVKCCIRWSRFSFFGPISPETCVIAAGSEARGLIRWPCGLTITVSLSCLSRHLSGSGLTERQQMQPVSTHLFSRCLHKTGWTFTSFE